MPARAVTIERLGPRSVVKTSREERCSSLPAPDKVMRHLALAALCRCIAIGVLFNAVCAAGAGAHAVLLEALPADGARLAQAPTEFVLRFNEPVVPMAVKLLDGQGAELAGVVVESGGETVVVHPSGPLPTGTYFL